MIIRLVLLSLFVCVALGVAPADQGASMMQPSGVASSSPGTTVLKPNSGATFAQTPCGCAPSCFPATCACPNTCNCCPVTHITPASRSCTVILCSLLCVNVTKSEAQPEQRKQTIGSSHRKESCIYTAKNYRTYTWYQTQINSHFVIGCGGNTYKYQNMRPLTEDETRTFFEKLAKYVGRNIRHLIDRPDEEYCFRLHKDRVFYVSEKVMKRAAHSDREHLASLGTCFGKFTKTKKFKLHITCLDYLAQYAKYKVWVKPSGEMSFLYNNHVLKAHVGRMTENTPQYQGVVVYSMTDAPLGFGVTAVSTLEARRLAPTSIVVFHQADCGEYLRNEDTLS